MAPEASPDGGGYHLGLVARYFREHGFHPITWNIYASLSEGAEMLFLFAFAFGKHSAAALVHFAFLVALAWQMIAYSRRAGFPVLGYVRGAVGICQPGSGNRRVPAPITTWRWRAWHSRCSTCYSFGTRNGSTRLLILIGLVAGFGYAVKYTACLGVAYAVGFVAWKSRRGGGLRHAGIVAACAAVLILPWMIKNWLWVQNPVSPFFNNIFPNPYVTTSFEKEFRGYLAIYDLPTRWMIPWAVTTSGRLAGVLGPVFLLAPIALLSLRRREGRQLLLAAAVFGATYFSNIGARFLIAPLPFVALAMMLALGKRGFRPRGRAGLWRCFTPRSPGRRSFRKYALPGVWALGDDSVPGGAASAAA